MRRPVRHLLGRRSSLVMLLLGLVPSWWAVLALPAAALIGFAFAAVGMAATTYMRSWSDTDAVQLVQMLLFLFSATFYPLSTYPACCSGWCGARRSTRAST